MNTHEKTLRAWVEIDLRKLRSNFDSILSHCPSGTQALSVVKDEAYGHGAVEVARIALRAGIKFFAVSNIYEGIQLREAGIDAPILLLGERHPDELPECLRYDLTCSVSEESIPRQLAQLNPNSSRPIPVHIKIDTGMSRYGVRWNQAIKTIASIQAIPGVRIEGLMTHFAMSDEEDKTFALEQIRRIKTVVEEAERAGIQIPIKHLCNSGGFLDLPFAHAQIVRVGILALGVYPSKVCRRIPGIEAVMTVKARIAKIRELEHGDMVGYGMRYKASERRRIGVIPIGYGDGFPRVRNEGAALVHGQRAPIIGGVSMDALTVDITDIPEAQAWDEVVLMGNQGNQIISVHEIAALKRSVSYDVLTSWRFRLPRFYLE